MLRPLALVLAPLVAGCFAAAAPPVVAISPRPTPIAVAPAPVTTEPAVVVLAPHLDARADAPAIVGVAECDRYIAMVDACPADAGVRQGGTRRLLEKDAPSWRELARSSTEGRLAVTFACQAALDGLRSKPCR